MSQFDYSIMFVCSSKFARLYANCIEKAAQDLDTKNLRRQSFSTRTDYILNLFQT